MKLACSIVLLMTIAWPALAGADAIDVMIDVKPWDSMNDVNLKSEGNLPVALLTTESFVATTVDPGSVRLGPTGWEAAPTRWNVVDVDADGDLDLLFQFPIPTVEIACGDDTLFLTASLATGELVRGSDSIHTLSCPPYGLAVTAFQDVAGVTDVELTAKAIAKSCMPPAEAEHILLKSYDLLGKVRWANNFMDVPMTVGARSSAAVLQFADMLRYQGVSAQVQVTNSKDGNIEVLRARTQVLFRPDLAVQLADAPAMAMRGAVVNIFAGIDELNGDLGASCRAYLMENGEVLDEAVDIWVDPLGSVRVAFTTVFSSLGIHDLTIAVGDVKPGDYDPSNDQATFSVRIILPPEPAEYTASYSRSTLTYERSEDSPYTLRYSRETRKEEVFSETLRIPMALTFPIFGAAMDLSADGVLKQSLFAFDIPSTSVEEDECLRCVTGFALLADHVELYISSYQLKCGGQDYTEARLVKSSYDMNYYSLWYMKRWGWKSQMWRWGSYGSFLNAASSVETRFIIADDGHAFGGDASFPVAPDEDYTTWDYWVDVTHYWGWERLLTWTGSGSGSTTFAAP
jgi:hypothetical protein